VQLERSVTGHDVTLSRVLYLLSVSDVLPGTVVRPGTSMSGLPGKTAKSAIYLGYCIDLTCVESLRCSAFFPLHVLKGERLDMLVYPLRHPFLFMERLL